MTSIFGNVDKLLCNNYKNLKIKIYSETVSTDRLKDYLTDHAENILLLNDDNAEPEASDSNTLLRLILLRDVAERTGKRLSITTEMQSIENQRLASQARVDDFVIGTDFVCRLMAQLSENPDLISFFEEFLDENGSELYMKPIANYISIGVPVDGYTLAESAARNGEIYVGYKHNNSEGTNLIVNPNKTESVIFRNDDQIIVIAED